eukprot:3206590-Amphidinium_carterae.1
MGHWLGGNAQGMKQSEKGYKDVLGPLLVDRRANAEWLRALDRTVKRGTGSCLSRYKPASSCGVSTRGEVRSKISAKEGDAERKYRICVKVEGEANRWLLQRVFAGDEEIAPSLHVSIDQGSVGFAGMMFLCTRLRVTCCADVFHRIHNDYLLSIGHCDLAPIRCAFKKLNKLRRGAWANEGNHSILNRCAVEFFGLHNHGHPLFQALFSDLMRELKIEDVAGNANDSLQQQVWQELARDLPQRALGEEVKSSRWWNAEVYGRHVLGRRWRLLLVLVQLGNVRRWWTSTTSCLFRKDSARVDSGDPEEGAENTDEVEKVDKEFRAKRMGILRYCCELLALDVPCCLYHGMCLLPVPIERWFEELLGSVKTRRGQQFFTESVSKGSWGFVVPQLLYPLSSEFADQLWASEAMLNTKSIESVLGKLWHLNLHFVGELILSLTLYRVPPFGFIRLLSADGAEVEEEMRVLKRTWELLLSIESRACTDPEVKSYLHHLALNSHVWVREMFVRLEELAPQIGRK